ncbi:E3 ubiquitin-protein ligase RNFT1, partial [Plecturocebus cupreus]
MQASCSCLLSSLGPVVSDIASTFQYAQDNKIDQKSQISHSHREAREPGDPARESGEYGTISLELCYPYVLQNSLLYILILGFKLIVQHIIGISLDIGLLTTSMNANKSIRKALRDLVCLVTGVISRLFCSSISYLLLSVALLHFNFSKAFFGLFDVLWVIGIADFILKFLYMSLKCFILLISSFIRPFKSKDYWYVLLEDLCQYYQIFVHIPVWFHYLIGYLESSNISENFQVGFMNILYTIKLWSCCQQETFLH